MSEQQTLHSACSVQLHMPYKVACNIRNWGYRHIKEKDLFYGNDEKGHLWGGRERDTHITISIGLEDEKEEQVLQKVCDKLPIKVAIGKVQRFECGECDVLYFPVLPNEKLNEIYNEVIPLVKFPSQWGFNPHSTIAYVKKGVFERLQDVDTSSGIEQEFYIRKVEWIDRQGEKRFRSQSLGESR